MAWLKCAKSSETESVAEAKIRLRISGVPALGKDRSDVDPLGAQGLAARTEPLVYLYGVDVVLVLAVDDELKAGERLAQTPLDIGQVDHPLRALAPERLERPP